MSARHLTFGALALALSCTGIVGGGEVPTGGGDATSGGAGGAGVGGGDVLGGGSAVGGGDVLGGGSVAGGAAEADGGDPATAACRVQAALGTSCASCHGVPPTQGAPLSLSTLAHLRASSPIVAGQTNAQRSVARLLSTSAPMPPAPATAPTSQLAATFSTWISAGMPDCQTDAGTPDAGPPPRAPHPNQLDQNQLFTCTNLSSAAPTRLRRINRWEWTRNVGGPVTRSWTGFSSFDNPFDPSAGERYGTYATDETVDDSMVEIVLPIVSEYGPVWAGPYTGSNRLDRLRTDTTLRCMFNDAAPSQSCVRHYLEVLLEAGVLYRPARVDEVNRLLAFSTTVLSQEARDGGQDARTHSITRIVNAASLTTGALFREELGTPIDGGRVALTDVELAQQLSYAIGSRGPGAVPTWRWPDFSAPPEGHYAELAQLAKDGGLRLDATVTSFIARAAGGVDVTRADLIQDFGDPDRSRRGEYWLSDGVAGFFREYFAVNDVAQVFKERPEATSRYDDGGTSPYREQLSGWGNLLDGYYGDEPILLQLFDDTVARVVATDTDVLRNLLTTRQYYLAATINTGFDGASTRLTGEPFNTTAVIDATRSQRWVTLPMSERAGLMTHPAFLAAHGGNFEDDPSAVHRGKWVREKLLCGYVPPLSEVRVQAKVGPHAADKNARRRLEEATARQECQACHALMNPLGYPFETYNHAGYLRRVDHATDGGWTAPSGQSTLTAMPDPALDGPVRDAVELSEKLAASPYVKRCFVRQTFRAFMGRDEDLSDACTLSRMEQAYDSNGGSFKALLGALMTSETWKTRRVPGAGE